MSETVYLLRAGESGPFKIGFTAKNVSGRVKQLQTGCYEKIRIIATICGDKTIENHLHTKFSQHRLQGEWFAPIDEIEETFTFAALLPQLPKTLPPTTSLGRDLIIETQLYSGLRERYPDGTIHSKIDWDSIAVEAIAFADEYSAWSAQQ